MQTLFANVPPHLLPRQRLFLSADIVGSTALKQKAAISKEGVHMSTSQSWFDTIQGFYIQCVQSFTRKWLEHREACDSYHCDHMYGAPPAMWKTQGDEILFRKDLANHKQVETTINAWMEAMGEVRAFVKASDAKLDVKSTAWVAEFPLQNKLVIRPNAYVMDELDPHNMETVGAMIGAYERGEARDKVSVDFVGPAIDIGFRLSQLATARKFIISLDTAYLMAVHDDEATPKIYYDGMTHLKGVMGGMHYPVFWLDASDQSPIERAEDDLLNRKSCDFDDVSRFCRAFYNETTHYAHAPFILTDTDPKIKRPPQGYEELHARVVDQYS
jgi:hypothetical protein